jgi:hypothetical protein
MIQIQKEAFEDAISGLANNVVAQVDFQNMANNNELIVVDDDETYLAKVDEQGKVSYKAVLCGYEGVSEYLSVHINVALEMVNKVKPGVLAFMNELFQSNPVIDKLDFDEKMSQYAKENGFEDKESALYLGITAGSFEKIKKNIKDFGTNKFLQDILHCFRNKYLPRRKTYSTNTGLVKDFVQGVMSIHGISLDIQYCDICNDHVAVDQCCNVNCKDDGSEPNYVCPAHSVEVDVPGHPFSKRPKVLCTNCNDKKECQSYRRF